MARLYEVPLALDGMGDAERAAYIAEVVAGYDSLATEADVRQAEAEVLRDDVKATAYRQDAAYCRMMANRARRGIFDEPDTHMSWYSFNEAIADRRLLSSIMADVDSDGDTDWSQQHRDVIGAALCVLTPTEKEVALRYYVGRVRRHDLCEMLSMELMTLDTHVRNINVKFRQWVVAVEAQQPVQGGLFGHLMDEAAPASAEVKVKRVATVAKDAPTSEQSSLFGSLTEG
jgi:hypothetical protein